MVEAGAAVIDWSMTRRRPFSTAGTTLGSVSNLSLLQRSSRVAFVGLMASALLVTAIAMIDAVRLVYDPFPGFFVNERLMASNFGRPGWTGPQGGIRYPDKLTQADGEVLSSVKDLRRVVERTSRERSIVYQVEREGRSLEIPIHTMHFTWWDLGATFGPTLVAGLIYLTLAAAVYVLKPDTAMTWVFVAGCLLIGTYQILTFDVATTHRFVKTALFVYAFVPAAGLHLSLLFPERKRLARRRWVQGLPYVVSVGLLARAYQQYSGPEFATVYAMIRLYSGVSVAAIVISVLHAYFRGASRLAMQRAKVVLFGAALAFPIPGVVNNLSLLGSTPGTIQVLGTFAPFPLLLFPASISYAIAKHNLFDVDVYIKRTVGYVLMTAVVAGGYFVLQSTVKSALLDPLLGRSADNIYPFLFALLTVFAFNPVSRAVQESVDRLFFRKAFDYKATVAALNESLAKVVDVRAFIDEILHAMRTDLFVDRAGVVLLDERSHTCESHFRGAKFGRDSAAVGEDPDPCLLPQDPLLALLAHEKRLVTKYDVAEDARFEAVREPCASRFEDLGASIAVPLFYHDQFAGALTLGYKQSGHFYTREDIDLVKTLSAMTSTAIEQSREKGQKAVLMQLFSKHVSPQVAESLWEQREQFLEGGRPKSQSMIVTAMFTDLQGFSTISENQSPEVLMGWLNTYLEMMTNTVMEHGGVVDDFFGDGVKINFGVPIPRTKEEDIEQDTVHAVACALAMEQRMIELNDRMTGQGQQPLRMRVGIHTGAVVTGSLGSAERMKYTTIGDTVNTAARLESFDKDLAIPELGSSPCRILISKETLMRVKDRFQVKQVGELSLKGKAERIEAYCVLGIRNDGKERPV